MAVTGACRCKAVTYRLAGVTLPATYACHCQDCQTWSGSAFAEHALLPEDALSLEGATVTYHHGEEGALSEQVVCGLCHTRLYNRNSAVPGMIVLRAGTLTDSDRLAPVAHIWVKRKQPWLTLPPEVPCWPESPTPAQFAEALQKSRG